MNHVARSAGPGIAAQPEHVSGSLSARVHAAIVLAAATVASFSNLAVAQLPEPTGLEAAAAVERVLVHAIAGAEKSVVAIARVSTDDDARATRRLSPSDPDFIPFEYGTGVVVDRRGLILTQYHVVREGDEHWVTTSDKKSYPATIRGADPRSGLAILAVEAADLVPIRFGDASRLRKGNIVIALGNPYAIARDGQASASWGIVANIARKAGPEPLEGAPGDRNTLHHFGTLIQTDAKLNLGTSGGALLNLRGEMVGLTTAVAATAGYEMSAGYAVPIDAAFRRVIEVLKTGREVEYGFLGIRPQNLDRSDLRQGKRGILVGHVVPGTPAYRGGLKNFDIITHVNDEVIASADDLMLHVGKLPADAQVRLQVQRDGRPLRLDVELAKYPVQGKKIVTRSPPVWRGIRVDYATAVENFDWYARRGDVDFDGCVVVTEVERDSPAWKEGLRPNMFLSYAAGVRVRKPKDFYAAVAGRQGSVAVRLVVPESEQPFRTIPAPE